MGRFVVVRRFKEQSGKRKAESGKWKVESGKWKLEDGMIWKFENGGFQTSAEIFEISGKEISRRIRRITQIGGCPKGSF